MIRYFLFLFTLLQIPLYAQFDALQVGTKTGFIFPERRVRDLFSWSYGVEIGVIQSTTGEHYWQSRLNYPRIFHEAGFYNFRQDVVGQAGALRSSLVVPFWQGSKIYLSAETGLGVSLFSKTNRAISQNFAFNIRLGGNLHYEVNPNYSLLLRYHIDHYSNGSIQPPNLGINHNNFGITWIRHRYRVETQEAVDIDDSPDPSFVVSAALGGKRTFAEDQLRPHMIFTLQYRYPIKKLWGITSGVAVFQNYSLRALMIRDQMPNPGTNRGGLFVGPHGRLERLWLELHFGFFLWNIYPEESKNFQNVVLGYDLSERLHVQLILRGKNYNTSYGLALGAGFLF